jgi:hypothetical protein
VPVAPFGQGGESEGLRRVDACDLTAHRRQGEPFLPAALAIAGPRGGRIHAAFPARP